MRPHRLHQRPRGWEQLSRTGASHQLVVQRSQSTEHPYFRTHVNGQGWPNYWEHWHNRLQSQCWVVEHVHGMAWVQLQDNQWRSQCSEHRCHRWSSLPTIVEEYPPEEIFSTHETALFYKLQPNKSLAIQGEDSHDGGKRSKERLTILPFSNMTGTEKLPFWSLGRQASQGATQVWSLFHVGTVTTRLHGWQATSSLSGSSSKTRTLPGRRGR